MDRRFADGLTSLASLGIRRREVVMRQQVHPSDVTAILSVRRYLRRYGPFDIIHCHGTKAGLIGRLAAVSMPIHSVYSPHAFVTMAPGAGRIYRFAAKCLEKLLSRLGDKIICVSEEERTHAVGLSLPAEKLSTITNGIDVESVRSSQRFRDRSRRRFGIRNAEVCIGFVGRLSPQKAPEMLIRAFSRIIKASDSRVKLVLVGEGPLKPALESLVSQLTLQEHVVLAGDVDGPEAMAAFDLLALPSQYEACPYVLLEALALGLPVVTTAVGGVGRLVRQNENGEIVPVGATEEFSDALKRLVSDESLRRQMGSASLKMSKAFIGERMVLEIAALYQRLISQCQSRPGIVVSSASEYERI
jgi:glycosyltransferase involved in cell wall biosynthesis